MFSAIQPALQRVSPKSDSVGIKTLPTLPAAYSWFPYSIYFSPTYAWSTFSFDAVKPTGGTTYYVSQSGLSTNDGLTPATALDSIPHALAKAGCQRIIITSAKLDRTRYASSTTTLSADLIIESNVAGGTVITGSDQGQVWTQNGTYANVYQRTRAGVISVWDESIKDSRNYWTQYTLQTSVAAVASNTGSYYVDGSNILYVSMKDGRAADDYIHPFLSITFAFQSTSGNKKLWLNNISFAGVRDLRFQNTSTTAYLTVYLQNGWARYNVSGTQNGIAFLGVDAYSRNFTGDKCAADGLNYHANASRVCHVYEDNYGGADNGVTDNGSNNATTIHDASSIIRLNCKGYRTTGPVIADITAGTTSLNVCCGAFDSASSVNDQSFAFYDSNVWLVNCNASGSAVDLYVGTGATVRDYGFQDFNKTVTGSYTKVSNLQDLFA